MGGGQNIIGHEESGMMTNHQREPLVVAVRPRFECLRLLCVSTISIASMYPSLTMVYCE